MFGETRQFHPCSTGIDGWQLGSTAVQQIKGAETELNTVCPIAHELPLQRSECAVGVTHAALPDTTGLLGVTCAHVALLDATCLWTCLPAGNLLGLATGCTALHNLFQQPSAVSVEHLGVYVHGCGCHRQRNRIKLPAPR